VIGKNAAEKIAYMFKLLFIREVDYGLDCMKVNCLCCHTGDIDRF